MGGHYYAYILDTQAQTWYNFNDYRVNPSDVIELVEMFGGQSGRMSSNSTNAYMLMYKLCDQQSEIKDDLAYDIP